MARGTKTAGPTGLVAAATRVRLSKRPGAKQGMKRQSWQTDAWEYFDLIPEVKYATWFLGNAMTKVRLFVATRDPANPEGPPIPVSDPLSAVPPEVAAQAEAELARLSGQRGGQPEILREMEMNLEVTGEGYLVGRGVRYAEDGLTIVEPERWFVASISEVEYKGDRWLVKDENETELKLDLPDDEGYGGRDALIRFWQRHPRYSGRADCNLRSVLEECETLLVLQRQVRADSRSRLPAGLLVVANEISISPADPSRRAEGNEDGDEFVETLAAALAGAIEDESDPAGLAPSVLRVPGEFVDKIQHIDLARKTDEKLDARIEARVERLARGLNLPVETVKGHMNTTFANAEQIDEDLFDDHVEPRVRTLCDLLTYEFLRVQVLEAFRNEATGTVPENVEDAVADLFVWYDPSALIGTKDPSEAATEGHNIGAISDEAWRKYKGFSEDDAPDEIELLIRTAIKRGGLTSDLTLELLRLTGVDLAVTDSAEAPNPNVEPEASDDQLRTLVRLLAARRSLALERDTPRPVETISSTEPRPEPDEDLGRTLTEIDRELRIRLQVAADRAVERAVERAGSVIRSKVASAKDVVRGVAPSDIPSTVGRNLVAAAGLTEEDLIGDAIDGLEASFMRWGESAYTQAINYVSRSVGGFTKAERDVLGLRTAEGLAEAWGWLREHLRQSAAAAMWDPASLIDEIGEYDPSVRVQAGIIRAAMARAGGATAVQTTGAGDAFVIVGNGNRPVGGIATGEFIRAAMEEKGASVDAYKWVYGPAFRANPFEPHQRLDGVTFHNFDDPVLSNPNPFPTQAFYIPGDHAGCVCDFEMVVIPPNRRA